MGLEQLDLFSAGNASPKQEKGKTLFTDDRIKVKIKNKKKKVLAAKNPEEKRGRKSTKEIYAAVDLIDIPDDETLSQKLYYSISEVAGWFNVTTSQIRFWENEFDILQL